MSSEIASCGACPERCWRSQSARRSKRRARSRHPSPAAPGRACRSTSPPLALGRGRSPRRSGRGIVQLKSEDEISRNEISLKFREISSAPSAFHEIHCCSTSAGFRMECHFNEISRAAAPSPRHVDQLRSALRLRPVADHCRRPPTRQGCAPRWLRRGLELGGGPESGDVMATRRAARGARRRDGDFRRDFMKFHRNFTGPSRPRRRLGMHEISIEISIS